MCQLWHETNMRKFQDSSGQPEAIVNHIKFLLYTRAYNFVNDVTVQLGVDIFLSVNYKMSAYLLSAQPPPRVKKTQKKQPQITTIIKQIRKAN